MPDFPTTPVDGDTHVIATSTWEYYSSTDRWEIKNTGSGSGGGASGGTEFISSTTISNAANFTFTDFDSDKYDNYMMLVSSVIPVSNSFLFARTSSNGSSYDSGFDYGGSITTNGINQTVGNTTEIRLAQNTSIASTSTGCNLVITLYDVHNSSIYTSIMWSGGMPTQASPPMNTVLGVSSRKENAAIAGFQIFFSTGNIQSGKIAVYGIKKS